MSLSDSIENARTSHRHGRAWSWLIAEGHNEPDVPAEERDPRAVRWLCLALGAFWVGLVVWVVVG